MWSTGGMMDIGMLWFDNDPKSDVLSKVIKAAAYYRSKYGRDPNLCFVHPSMIPEVKTNAGRIAVQANSTVLPHHFWIGVQQQKVSQKI
jgi:hypothetical protein